MRTVSVVGFGLLVLAAGPLTLRSGLAAQTGWVYRTTTLTPPGRAGHGFACDPVRGRIVMFGGNIYVNSSWVVFGDTWEWDGVSWTQNTPAQSPLPRSGVAMCFDAARGRVVLFGGAMGTNSSYYVQDTWEWDGTNWTKRTPPTIPPPRAGARMAYDETRQVVVMYGGFHPDYGSLTDTWEWNGTTWTWRSPATNPGVRSGFGMAYDSARSVTVLYGGIRTESGVVWEYDGNNWQRVIPTGQSSTGRLAPGMVYDKSRGRCVMFGGYFIHPQAGSIYLNDTLEYDGVSWVSRTITGAPMQRAAMEMAYLPSRRSVVMFGGYYSRLTPPEFNDTWEYSPLKPADFKTFGSGCPGAGGVPDLTADGISLPWLGNAFTAKLSHLGSLPQQNLPLVLLGDSKSIWGSLGLPFDMGPMGMPGCTLYTNPLVLIPLQNVAGTATWTLPLPLVPSLAGLSVYAQGGVTSPGTNPLGLVMSNAAELKLGEK